MPGFLSVLFTSSLVFGPSCVTQEFVSAPASTTLPQTTPLEKGQVQGNTYRNKSLGLSLTVAPDLTFGIPEMKGVPGTTPLLVKVSAWGQRNPPSVSLGTIFYADALAYYSSVQRSVDAYVRKVTSANLKVGFAPVDSHTHGQLGGVLFHRSDFRKGSVYEAVFVQTCGSYAFVFIFVSPDVDGANRLISETRVNLDAHRLACAGDGPDESR